MLTERGARKCRSGAEPKEAIGQRLGALPLQNEQVERRQPQLGNHQGLAAPGETDPGGPEGGDCQRAPGLSCRLVRIVGESFRSICPWGLGGEAGSCG